MLWRLDQQFRGYKGSKLDSHTPFGQKSQLDGGRIYHTTGLICPLGDLAKKNAQLYKVRVAVIWNIEHVPYHLNLLQ